VAEFGTSYSRIGRGPPHDHDTETRGTTGSTRDQNSIRLLAAVELVPLREPPPRGQVTQF
jgi:hypothetical protein